MGLDNRDYMRNRNRSGSAKGPWRNGKLVVQPAPYSLLKKALVFSIAIIVLTWLFERFPQSEIASSLKSVFRPVMQTTLLPATGNVTLYQLGHSAPAVASFTVTAKPSHAAVSHLVKLVDISSGQPVLSVFVRSGETASIKVPLGSYKVNIATGEKWYGETKLFGKGMIVMQGKAPMDFYAEGNSITGHTLTLDDVIDGNYPTRPLSADNF
jgi:hypothetical protein